MVKGIEGMGPTSRGPKLGISIHQLYGDSPMEVTLAQLAGDKVTQATFIIDATAALRLVAILAPLAGRVLDK